MRQLQPSPPLHSPHPAPLPPQRGRGALHELRAAHRAQQRTRKGRTVQQWMEHTHTHVDMDADVSRRAAPLDLPLPSPFSDFTEKQGQGGLIKRVWPAAAVAAGGGGERASSAEVEKEARRKRGEQIRRSMAERQQQQQRQTSQEVEARVGSNGSTPQQEPEPHEVRGTEPVVMAAARRSEDVDAATGASSPPGCSRYVCSCALAAGLVCTYTLLQLPGASELRGGGISVAQSVLRSSRRLFFSET